MGANSFKRYVWLAQTLFNRSLSLQKIQEMSWGSGLYRDGRDKSRNTKGEISRATFNKHRRVLKSMFDIDIKWDKVGKKYFIEEKKDSSAYWLLLAMLFNWQLRDAKLSTYVKFYVTPPKDWFDEIINAMKANATLYITESSDDILHTVHPSLVRLRDAKLEVLGYNEDEDQIRWHCPHQKPIRQNMDTRMLPDDFNADDYWEKYP